MIYLNGQATAEFVPEIADNLTTDDSAKALSAKQGKVLNEKTAYDIPFTNVMSTGGKIQELSVQSARVLKAFTWNYTAQSFEVNASETFILYGARAGRGLLYIVPINNNEICEVYDSFGVTVTHTSSADLKTHTISLSATSNPVGSTCQLFVISRNI